MINNPKDIEEVLKELENITLEELDDAIKKVDKEYMEIEYETEEIYNIKVKENYYLNEDYYDFYLHMSKGRDNKKIEKNKNNIGEVA